MHISINKQEISINGTKLNIPLYLNDLENIFGHTDTHSVGDTRTSLIWNNLGISSLIDNINYSYSQQYLGYHAHRQTVS